MSVPRTVALIARSTNIDSRNLGKVRLSVSGVAAVADVPSEVAKQLLALSPLDGEVTVSIPDELPELQETREREGGRDGGRSYGSSVGRSSGGGGNRSRFSNSGGSSGGGSREGGNRGSRDFADREFRPRDERR